MFRPRMNHLRISVICICSWLSSSQAHALQSKALQNSAANARTTTSQESESGGAQLPKITTQAEQFGNLLQLGTPDPQSPNKILFENLNFQGLLSDLTRANHQLHIRLRNLPDGVIANYHFPSDPDFHAFPPDGLLLPTGVDMVLVQLTRCSGSCPPNQKSNPPAICPKQSNTGSSEQDETGTAEPDYAACEKDIVFVRDLLANDKGTGSVFLQPAFIITVDGLQIASNLPAFSSDRRNANYTVNGTPITDFASQGNTDVNFTGTASAFSEALFGWRSIGRFKIERYAGSNACSLYLSTKSESLDVNKPSLKSKNGAVDNGITVAPAKVFDSFTLKQMLANTSAQLAGISGFNQSVLMGALGNIQGVTRDSSYLSAQVTTLAPPSITSTAVNGGTASNTLANTLGVNNGSTNSISTITCPPGTLPGIGTSGLPACAAVISGTATVASTGAGNVNGGASNSTSQQSTTGSTLSSTANVGQTSNQQNTVTTTTTGQAGIAPTAPASTAFAAPTNLGLSASDMLAEQVQLNSEITTLRLLLQGALSDQYLVKETRATGTRQQTTVGFGIYLDPPARFRHAVAEVKVYIEPDAGADPVSVMNLLPATKTYNVAKITSHQNAFGAGAVVEPVNIGIATGKSKDRLYLAKDTDTVALQYEVTEAQTPGFAEPLSRSVQEHIADGIKEAEIWQAIGDSCDDVLSVNPNALEFGWQFRPVLGADYVQAGQRLVYAQLALPVGLGEQYAPLVHVQTRWREYDEKRQVAGAVFKGSCSIVEDLNPITVVSPLRVHKVYVDDMGGGALKVSANGSFFSSGFSVMSGPNVMAPTTFDGQNIQLFGNAQSLLLAQDLKLVAEDGTTTRLASESRFGAGRCGIQSAQVSAVPRPDGNSLVEARFVAGSSYSLNVDREPNPLILIGAQVYGLHETPFIDKRCEAPPAGALACTYHFLAATDVLRTAQRFQVADLAWRDFQASGKIDFAPAFTTLSVLGSPKATKPAPPSAAANNAPSPALYSISGFELSGLRSEHWNCQHTGCLELYRGLNRFRLSNANFQILSKTNAVLSLDDTQDQVQYATKRATEEADNHGLGGAAKAAYVKKAVGEAQKQIKLAASQYDFKFLRLVYHPSDDSAIEWDLNVPSQTAASISASAILNVGDSTQLTFSSVVLAGGVQSLMYESTAFPNTAYNYDSAKQALTVQIPSTLTNKAGHKELIVTDSVLNSNGKANQIRLPFDVTKR